MVFVLYFAVITLISLILCCTINIRGYKIGYNLRKRIFLITLFVVIYSFLITQDFINYVYLSCLSVVVFLFLYDFIVKPEEQPEFDFSNIRIDNNGISTLITNKGFKCRLIDNKKLLNLENKESNNLFIQFKRWKLTVGYFVLHYLDSNNIEQKQYFEFNGETVRKINKLCFQRNVFDFTDNALVFFYLISSIVFYLIIKKKPEGEIILSFVGIIIFSIWMFQERQNNGKDPLIVLSIPLLLIISIYFAKFHGPLSSDSQDWANLGSFFSGLAGPVLTFLTVYLLIKQLQRSRKEFLLSSQYNLEGLEIQEKILNIENTRLILEKLSHQPNFVIKVKGWPLNTIQFELKNIGKECSNIQYKINDSDIYFYELKNEIPTDESIYLDISLNNFKFNFDSRVPNVNFKIERCTTMLTLLFTDKYGKYDKLVYTFDLISFTEDNDKEPFRYRIEHIRRKI